MRKAGMSSLQIRRLTYAALYLAIAMVLPFITGQIPAGSRIVETVYANKLHISRTPLREALRKLERDGLVEYVMRRGVVVRAFTIDDIEQIYTIRNSLEMLTLPYIIENATAEDIAALRAKLAEMDDEALFAYLSSSPMNFYQIVPTRIVVTSPWFLNVYDSGYARQFVDEELQEQLAAVVAEKYPEAQGLTDLDYATFSATGLKTQQTLTFGD